VTTGLDVPADSGVVNTNVVSLFQFEVVHSGVASEPVQASRGALTSGTAPVVQTLTFTSPKTYITEEQYPVLARIWDNDDDAIFDSL